MANGISVNTVKPNNSIIDSFFADGKYRTNLQTETSKQQFEKVNSILSQTIFASPNEDATLAPWQETIEKIQEGTISSVPNAAGEFPLEKPAPSTLKVPEGYKEAYQYWSTSELMTFQFELALQTRWQSIGTKALLNAVSIVKDVGSIIGGLWDWSGMGGVASALSGKTANSGSSAFAPTGWIIPIKGYTGAIPKRDTPGGYDVVNTSRAAGNGTNGKHAGVDLFMSEGTPVLAVTSGMVTSVVSNGNSYGGNYVMHNDTTDTYGFYYTHLQSVAQGVAKGKMVTAGQVIGYVGTTGNAAGTPAHLHFGIKDLSQKDNSMNGYIDPEEVLRNATVM